MNNDRMTLYRRYKANAEDTAIEWQAGSGCILLGELLYDFQLV